MHVSIRESTLLSLSFVVSGGVASGCQRAIQEHER